MRRRKCALVSLGIAESHNRRSSAISILIFKCSFFETNKIDFYGSAKGIRDRTYFETSRILLFRRLQ